MSSSSNLNCYACNNPKKKTFWTFCNIKSIIAFIIIAWWIADSFI